MSQERTYVLLRFNEHQIQDRSCIELMPSRDGKKLCVNRIYTKKLRACGILIHAKPFLKELQT